MYINPEFLPHMDSVQLIMLALSESVQDKHLQAELQRRGKKERYMPPEVRVPIQKERGLKDWETIDYSI